MRAIRRRQRRGAARAGAEGEGAGRVKSLTLVVQAFTMGQITPPQQKGLLDAIRGGDDPVPTDPYRSR
jgi:hypothetical protein